MTIEEQLAKVERAVRSEFGEGEDALRAARGAFCSGALHAARVLLEALTADVEAGRLDTNVELGETSAHQAMMRMDAMALRFLEARAPGTAPLRSLGVKH